MPRMKKGANAIFSDVVPSESEVRTPKSDVRSEVGKTPQLEGMPSKLEVITS